MQEQKKQEVSRVRDLLLSYWSASIAPANSAPRLSIGAGSRVKCYVAILGFNGALPRSSRKLPAFDVSVSGLEVRVFEGHLRREHDFRCQSKGRKKEKAFHARSVTRPLVPTTALR
jgi:hypothetical protein